LGEVSALSFCLFILATKSILEAGNLHSASELSFLAFRNLNHLKFQQSKEAELSFIQTLTWNPIDERRKEDNNSAAHQ